ncbi:hypothetical protein ACTA71_000998 [Dictyostelium dimigraforme]
MLTQDEHREACRVYMQKYRSKPENREKIRQQNAEYRKRKKQESIRQVTEIGSLETTLDSQNARISQLEKQLIESNFKVNLFEKEKLIPKNYLNIINTLRLQLTNAQNEIEEQKNTISFHQQQQQSLQHQLQSLQLQQQQQLELINAYGNGVGNNNNNNNNNNSPSSSNSLSLPPTPTSSNIPLQPSFHSSFSAMNGSTVTTTEQIQPQPQSQQKPYVNKKQKVVGLFNQESSPSSSSSFSSPPSSPSLQYLPNSPALPNSLTSSPSPTPSIGSAVSTPQISSNFSNSSTGSLSSLVPFEENGSNIVSPCTNSFKQTSHFTLDLLCDVLQSEKSLQLPPSSPQEEKRNSGDFKTSIGFVLNDIKL